MCWGAGPIYRLGLYLLANSKMVRASGSEATPTTALNASRAL